MPNNLKIIDLEFSTKIRIRYAETDKMGYCYYGNYASFFEVARVDALRETGILYSELEKSGILLPVTKFEVSFFSPAFYDELIKIKTKIVELEGVRIGFEYQTINQKGKLLNKAYTQLVFVSAANQKPMAIPVEIIEKLTCRK